MKRRGECFGAHGRIDGLVGILKIPWNCVW
jgi:hypothetical protein